MAVSESGAKFWVPVSARVLVHARDRANKAKWVALGMAPIHDANIVKRTASTLSDNIPHYLKEGVLRAVEVSTLPVVTALVNRGRLAEFVVDDDGIPALDVDRWLATASPEELLEAVATSEEMASSAVLAFQTAMEHNDLTVTMRGVSDVLPIREHLTSISAEFSQVIRSANPVVEAQLLGATI